MSNAYKIHKQDACYYLTLQVVSWADIFTRNRYCKIVVDSLNYCVSEKGLEIFAYVIMSNHIHIIARSSKGELSGVVRDFKSHTSKQILKSIQEEPESRREWLLRLFEDAASKHKRNEKYQLWTHENHPEEVFSPSFTLQRINYIHQNPVRAGIVDEPHEYRHSSAVDYAGKTGLVKVEVLNLHLMMS